MVHQVDTGAPVLAWLLLTLVHFVLAVDTLVSWDTLPGASRKDKKSLERCWKRTVSANEPWEAPVTLCPQPPPGACVLLWHRRPTPGHRPGQG